ncbi:TPA: O-antigen ligase family protein [Citrobacter freundii]|nr:MULTISPECIES: O-antigen ligase family protein [Citrobacter]EGT0626433.1 hypothetical protein [Citrobacter freundii]EKW3668190.1 O-antigen ligase family protein [Citrobacter freundii]ELI7001313.1 O-antigen ligase family protein [Citrobacter freundii]ELK7470543.1 O-antigen ligase family protein [Citrobacter freundii]KEL81161.1 O-antigen ligase like membrane family protein [Citrobacter freundii]
MHKRNISENFFMLFLLLMPINNIYEVYAMKQGILPYGGWSMALTPATIKVYKDLFVVIFSILVFSNLLKSHKYRIVFFSYLVTPIHFLMALIAVFVCTSLISNNVINAVLGARAYINVIYIFVGLMLYPVLNKKRMHNILFFLLLFQLSLQSYQYVDGQGLAVFAELRSPGFFIVPATAGLFSLLLFYVLPRSKLNFFLCFLSLILSTSTIGLVIFILTVLYSLCRRYINRVQGAVLFSVAAICVLIILYNFSANIIGRGAGAIESFNARIGILSDVFIKSDIATIIWGNGFGNATSQAALSETSEHFITDNTFLSLFLNMGIIAVILYMAFLVTLFIADRSKMIFFTVLLYSITANIFELNPVSAFLFVVVGFNYYEHHVNTKSPVLANIKI